MSSRRAGHWLNLRKGRHSNPHLQSAWNKYGESAFEWGILETCEKSSLLDREQFHFDTAAVAGERLFNILRIAGSNAGLRHSDETKRKVSERSKQMWRENPEIMLAAMAQNGVTSAATKRAKTHCRRGHEFTPENTLWQKNGTSRLCRICNTATHRRRRRVAGDPFGPPCHHRDQTHCKHGHEYTPENTVWSKKGHRWCKTCKAAADARFHEAHKEEQNAANNRRYHAGRQSAA